MSDLQLVALGLTTDLMSIDSENSLFKQILPDVIPNPIERSQFNKRRRMDVQIKPVLLLQIIRINLQGKS